MHRYSITSSALVSSVGGTVRPSDAAVFKLIAKVNLVGSLVDFGTKAQLVALPPKRLNLSGRNDMTVTAILSRKGNDVFTIEPVADLASAAKILVERRIGALVVTGDDNRVDGIVSERTIVRACAERGVKALAVTVAEVMTRDVVTCGLTDTVSEIMERMTDGRFRHVPVVEQGRLAGIVSIGDVVKWRLHEMKHESAAMRDYIRTA